MLEYVPRGTSAAKPAQVRGASAPLFGRPGKASRRIKPPLAAASCALNPSNSSTATIPLRGREAASVTLANWRNLPRFRQSGISWDILGHPGISWGPRLPHPPTCPGREPEEVLPMFRLQRSRAVPTFLPNPTARKCRNSIRHDLNSCPDT